MVIAEENAKGPESLSIFIFTSSLYEEATPCCSRKRREKENLRGGKKREGSKPCEITRLSLLSSSVYAEGKKKSPGGGGGIAAIAAVGLISI